MDDKSGSGSGSGSSGVVAALEAVAARLHAGLFHSQYDAMCLASVELALTPTATSTSTSTGTGTSNGTGSHSGERVSFITALAEVRALRGLQGLSSELLGILNSATVSEQAPLAFLQQQLEALHCSVVDQREPTGGLNSKEDSHGVEVGKEKVATSGTGTLASEWNSLPLASDELSPGPVGLSKGELMLQPSSQILGMRSHTHRQLQPLYDEAFTLLANKTRTLELIDALIGSYVAGLARLATAGGIKYAMERAQYIVQPHLLDLLSHRYLDTTQPKAIMRSLQSLAAQTYLRGHDDLAKCRLALDYQSTQQESAGLDVGSFKKGAVAVLLLWAVSECFNNERAGRDIWKDPTFSIFVCLGDLTLLLWLWGASISVWRRAGIDYLGLLSLHQADVSSMCQGDYTSSVPEQTVFRSATDLSLVYLFAFVIFNKALRGSFSYEGEPAAAHAIPSVLLLFYASRFFYPFASSRVVYLRMLWKVLAAPYYAVKFRDGYIGDLLTSLVRVSISLAFSIIYLTVEVFSWLTNRLEAVESTRMSPWWQRSYLYRFQLVPFLTLLPLWLRFMQCLRRSLESGQRWPHLFNALKYACAIMVFSFGVLHPDLQRNGLWILCLCCATCYQYFWDVTMDWGLIQVNKGGRVSFRKELTLGSRRFYYAVMLGNFILRFAWAITYIPREIHHYSPLYSYVYNNFQTVMAAAEIMRRMVWGFLRLEWEHIEKTGSAPLSLHRQHTLAREAAMKGLGRREKDIDVGMGVNDDLEMEKMDVCSGHEQTAVGSGTVYIGGRSLIAEEDGQGEFDDSDMLLEPECELYWLMDFLPFDIDTFFPFFFFKGLRESISYPRRRFHARVLEVFALSVFVICVMSISALTKMHSAGYI